MRLWDKVFGRSKASISTAPTPDASWHASESECVREAMSDVHTHSPKRVLVVGAVGALTRSLAEAAATERLPHNLLINEQASLKWLGDTLSMVRETRDPFIILSPYPRRSRPPTIHVLESVSFQAPVQRKIVLEGVSLTLRAPDQDVPVAVYLIGLYTSGYWKSLLESQDGLRRPIERFRMLASRDCRAFIDSESEAIDATAPGQQLEKLLQLSALWETDPKSSLMAYEGPVLTP